MQIAVLNNLKEQSEKELDKILDRLFYRLRTAISEEETKRLLLAWRDKAIALARHKDGEDYKNRLEKAVIDAGIVGQIEAFEQVLTHALDLSDRDRNMLKTNVKPKKESLTRDRESN